MELTDQELEELEGYYNHSLTPEKRAALELRRQADEVFDQEASLFLNGLHAMEVSTIRSYRYYLRSKNAEVSPILQISWLKKWSWVAAAASVGIVIAIGWWWSSEKSADPLVAFAQREFVAPPTRGLVMQVSNEALTAYDNGEYKRAIPLLLKAFVMSKDQLGTPQDSIKLFYASICYIAEKQPEKAISILEKMKHSNKAKDPIWYLALAYMMKGEGEKAKTLLLGWKTVAPPQYLPKIEEAFQIIDSQNKQ